MELVYKAAPVIKALEGVDIVIVDTETSSLYPWRDGQILAGIGVKPYGGATYYMPLRHADSKNASFKQFRELCEALRGKTIVFHNPKFDLAVIYNDGVNLVNEDVLDTVVMMRLVYEEQISYELKRLGKIFVDPNAGGQEKELKKFMRSAGIETYDKIPATRILPYVSEDLVLTEGLYDVAMPLIMERTSKAGNLIDLLGLEKKVTRVLFYMEKHGFLLDREYIAGDEGEHVKITDLIETFKDEIYSIVGTSLRERVEELESGADVEAEIKSKATIDYELAVKGLAFFESAEPQKKDGKKAKTFNHNSAPEVKKIFHGLGIHSSVMTKGGKSKGPQESWAKIALAEIDHPLADLVVKCRAMQNIEHYYSTFEKLMGDDDVIHCSLHQAGTKTGRLSCREPNLQNIPRFEGFTGSKIGAIASMAKLRRKQAKEKEEAKEKKERYKAIGRSQYILDAETQAEITSELEGELFGKVRGSFIPRPGCFLIFPDWSQIELRIFADYAQEEELLRTFDLGLDVHKMTALAAFGQLPTDTESQMYKWLRNMGKQIAFGLLYGMGITLLAAEIGKSKDEAQLFMDNYFGRFKNAKKFIDEVVRWCVARAKSETRPGYVYNRWGRRRYLSPSQAYKAVNFLIQGSAADLMKEALVNVFYAIADFKTRLLLTVHDELIFEIPYAEAETVVPVIMKTMSHSERIKCKLKVDLEWSPTRWSEKRDANCKTCNGKGQTIDQSEDALLEALYRNDRKLLDAAKATLCVDCDGKGYDLSEIREYIDAA